MRTQNIGFIVFKTLFFDTIRDIIHFPIWWYSKGLISIIRSYAGQVTNAERTLGVLIWMRNILRPMYGQYDIPGRLISILVRVIQIIVRSVILFVWVLVLTLRVVVWVFLPIVIAVQILYQITGGFLSIL